MFSIMPEKEPDGQQTRYFNGFSSRLDPVPDENILEKEEKNSKIIFY